VKLLSDMSKNIWLIYFVIPRCLL